MKISRESAIWGLLPKLPVTRLIRTWEMLRLNSRLEKSSDEVEDVEDD